MSTKTSRERRDPLTPAQQTLAARYLPMARALAKPLKAAWPAARDEFESAACLALVEAAEAFDPSRNVKFSTFARYRIWGALRDVQRKQFLGGYAHPSLGGRGDEDGAEPRSHVPMLTRLSIYAEEYGTVLNTTPDGPVGEEIEAIEAVEEWLRKLPPRHAAACRQIYLHGKTHNEAAEHLGCSQSRIGYMHREAMAMLNGTWNGSPPPTRNFAA